MTGVLRGHMHGFGGITIIQFHGIHGNDDTNSIEFDLPSPSPPPHQYDVCEWHMDVVKISKQAAKHTGLEA